MNRHVVCVAACAGFSTAVNAQLMKMLVSTDGVTFSDSVAAKPGDTVQVLVTASYTGTSTTVYGFGSANFQPTVSNWHATDTLLPLLAGGNQSPSDGSGMVMPQFYSGVTAGGSTASYGHVQAGYVPGTYGRVLPMGRVPLQGANALQGFVHNNPDGTGTTYLRIAQANNPNWIGTTGNTAGSSGVACGQILLATRVQAEPDFWGNRESTFDPDIGWMASDRIPANDSRRVNVELFRFGFTLDLTTSARDLVVDAPLAGQQISSNNMRYMGLYLNPVTTQPSLTVPVVVQTGVVHVVPAPGTVAGLGLYGLATRRRR